METIGEEKPVEKKKRGRPFGWRKNKNLVDSKIVTIANVDKAVESLNQDGQP